MLLIVLCCSPNPYEEGTESGYRKPHNCAVRAAAAQIPMKRELKDMDSCISLWIFSIAAAQIPMKRELKVEVEFVFARPKSMLQPKSL